MRRAAAALLVGWWAAGVCSCTVDTELGVAAEVETASVTVSDPDGAGDVVGVQLRMRFRVGEHAEGTRTFIVPRADVMAGETPVAQVNLDRPVGFDGTLAPGESETVAISGRTRAGDWPSARDQLCGAPGATLLVRWEDTTAMEIGMIDAPASITCD